MKEVEIRALRYEGRLIRFILGGDIADGSY